MSRELERDNRPALRLGARQAHHNVNYSICRFCFMTRCDINTAQRYQLAASAGH